MATDYTHVVVTRTKIDDKTVNADIRAFFIYDDADEFSKAQSQKGLTCEFWSYLEVE